MAINIKKFAQDKTAKPFEISGVTFYLKPLNRSQYTIFSSKAMTQNPDIYTHDVKASYARDHVTGWDGLVDDDGETIQFDTKTAIELLTDERYEDLFCELYHESFVRAQKRDKQREEDQEAAKKP